MKKRFLLLLLLSGTLCFFSASTVQAQFTISGEFRPRPEYRNGYIQPGDSSMHGYPVILGRSRISFDYSNEKISTRFSLQHAFVFGENNFSSDTISKNTVNIFEGWFKYSFTKDFSVRIGRMVLNYDDQRVLGASNWKQWGSTHDAVIAGWSKPGFNYKGDFGFAINNAAPASTYLSSYNLKNYKYMAYLWQQKKFLNDALSVSVTLIMDAQQKPSTTTNQTTSQTLFIVNAEDSIIGTTVIKTTSKVLENYPNTLYARATAGAYAIYSMKNLTLSGSIYYQGGHYKDGRKLTALFAGGYVSYQIIKPLRLLVGFEHLSGNDLSDTTTLKTKVKGFSTLWGTNHGFYGYMDTYSSYLGKDALQYGLNDLYFRGTVSFSAKTSLEATYRMFSLPYGYLPASTGKTPYQTV
ncbi:MAG TPA: alginate export family protein, partial [Bacteroidales bacterium]|nr:alginate export family protein [Bacteroidales bacterium]